MGFGNQFKKMLGLDKNEDNELEDKTDIVNSRDADSSIESEKSCPTRNFRYLDELIHKGFKEIVLESDIVLDEYEESQYFAGIFLDAEDIIIDGNGHAIDARNEARIFKINGKSITLKNITFKNAYSSEGGGVIDNGCGKVTIENSIFSGNNAYPYRTFGAGAINNYNGEIKIHDCKFIANSNVRSSGGAINNNGIMTIENSLFEKNSANSDRESGGAIINEGTLTIRNSIFRKNESINGRSGAIDNDGILIIENSLFEGNKGNFNGGSIFNSKTLTVKDSSFEKNSSNNNGGAIYNYNTLNIEKSLFKDNEAQNGGSIETTTPHMIINDSEFLDNTASENGGAISCHDYNSGEKNALSLTNCSFEGNIAYSHGGAITNNELKIRMKNPEFKNNKSSKSASNNIYNNGYLILESVGAIDEGVSIINESIIYFNEDDENLARKIENNGAFFKSHHLKENHGNFKYLNELIQNSAAEITLDKDITLDISSGEENEFERGILIDCDSLVIDGKGHAIDARGLTRIFTISKGDVTLIDLTLKNAYFACGAAICNNAKLSLKKVNFKNNVSRGNCLISRYSSGGAILNTKILSIEKSLFENNVSLETKFGGGGAIQNNGTLTVENSIVSDNKAKNEGGAIYNEIGGICEINSVKFNNNQTENNGGAVYNYGTLSIEEGEFTQHNGKDLIYNDKGNMKIFKTEIMQNSGCEEVIFNNDQLRIENSIFRNNNAEKIIFSEKDSDLSISYAKFISNNLGISSIVNSSKQCIVSKTKFEGNISRVENASNIYNETLLILKNITLDEEVKSILNNGKILIKESATDIEDFIDNNGIVKRNIIPEKSERDFTSLNNQIQNCGNKKIILNHDISFEEYEKDFFEGGIDLDIDELTIDGKNHIIDAKNSSRIFAVTGKDITLKNIIFKNGHSNKDYDNSLNNAGGAIRINSMARLNIVKCRFIGNDSEENGGSIVNLGNLIIENTDFTNNSAENGGSIINLGKIEMIKNRFHENKANRGGAVYNSGEIKIFESELSNNSAISYGGAIYNDKDACLEGDNACFKENTIITKHALVSGGAIENYGKITINECTFVDNYLYEGRGPAIWIQNEAKTIQTACEFENNKVLDKDED